MLYDAMIELSIYFTAINDILAAYKIFSTRLWLIMGLSETTKAMYVVSRNISIQQTTLAMKVK